MDVGVRDLKQNLSKYLERAERGELIRVTDRGRPKAVIGPIPGRDRIEQGIAEAWITPAEGPGLNPLARGWSSDKKIAEVLDEDRGD